LRRDPPQDHPQVQGDDPAGGRHRLVLVVDHGEELLVRCAIGVLPRGLDPRLLQGRARDLPAGLTEPACRRAGQALDLGREPLLDLALDVDVRVQLGDQKVGDRVADLLVLEQLAAGPRPRIGLQRLPLHPQGEDREEADQRGQHHQRHGDDSARPHAALQFLPSVAIA
jgi:hypothetical protein